MADPQDSANAELPQSISDAEKGLATAGQIRSSAEDLSGPTEKPEDVFAAQSNDEPVDVPPLRGLSFLDRFLVIWIFLAMALGIILGNLVPSSGPSFQRGTFVGVSVPIAVGLLVMLYPILCKVRYESLHRLVRSSSGGGGGLWRQLVLSFALNWVVAPALMTGLAWAFLPDRRDLREGLVFVGVARCIAMVLVWTDLARGDGDYCAVLVAFNSLLQIVLFAPLAIFYTRVVSGGDDAAAAAAATATVRYDVVAKSVAVFLGIPLAAAVLTRAALLPLLGPTRYRTHFLRPVAPLSLVGLLYTIVVLFASQGAHVAHQVTSVLRVAAPLVVYFVLVFAGTVFLCRRGPRWLRPGRVRGAGGCDEGEGGGYGVACAQSFTAASNNFELAIAVCVATFGSGSGQSLAATVGPLIEVPVLIGLVYVLKFLKKRWNWRD